MSNELRCVILDIRGAIWPDALASPESTLQVRRSRLRRTLPAIEASPLDALSARCVEAGEAERVAGPGGDHRQDVDGCVQRSLRELGLPSEPGTVGAVRRALCVPFAETGLDSFPGAVDLLETLRELELRTVALSDASWRDAEAYEADFAGLGWGEYFDGIVSSPDAGVRKPNPAIFAEALAIAGVEAEAAAMVGNSETNDIEPAARLGMRTIRVAIEEPAPEPRTSTADEVAGSLPAVASIVAGWIVV